ncbi:hypothetical protein Nepgr_012971 [Nepenthes gracilis]|uniref:CASP-like protein n=1 Tax=Nepenthes gracilis TaxID=150966 RepID=A0AAD3XNW8_NEPGR|nr:hypothetical protein Nepgr_012971 [Nepenthes gracilis]
MEANAPFSRNRKASSSDRFILLFSQPPPSTTGASVGTAGGDELNEEDVFWTCELDKSSHHSNPPFNSANIPSKPLHMNGKGVNRPENFGILAALPEIGPDRSSRSIFNQKTAISPSSSPARMIPVLPRPPVEGPLATSLKCNQSAPVSVPMMPIAGERRSGSGFNYEDEEEDDEEGGEILPPHEMVARRSAKSPILSCSVLEGAGRTLKGRDLRQGCFLGWRIQIAFIEKLHGFLVKANEKDQLDRDYDVWLATADEGSAAAILYFAHKGNAGTNWVAILQQFGNFCQRMSGAVVATSIAALIFAVLVLLSAEKLMATDKYSPFALSYLHLLLHPKTLGSLSHLSLSFLGSSPPLQGSLQIRDCDCERDIAGAFSSGKSICGQQKAKTLGWTEAFSGGRIGVTAPQVRTRDKRTVRAFEL